MHNSLRDDSPQAMAELDNAIEAMDPDAQAIQDRLDAHSFFQDCRRDMEEEERLDRTEHIATEVLETLAAPIVGAVSLWTTDRGAAIGGIANTVIGAAAKIVSVINPKDRRGLRVASRAGKVFLYSQISITTRNLMEGAP